MAGGGFCGEPGVPPLVPEAPEHPWGWRDLLPFARSGMSAWAPVPNAEQKGLNQSTMTYLGCISWLVFLSLVVWTGGLFIFIALLINVEYSQGFFLIFPPLILSSLLFGKVTDGVDSGASSVSPIPKCCCSGPCFHLLWLFLLTLRGSAACYLNLQPTVRRGSAEGQTPQGRCDRRLEL